MREIKHKYQVEYEKSSGCFWEKEPAKYVKLLSTEVVKSFNGLYILDLGAGEGKNSVYLANLGAIINAIDLSPIALSRFDQQPNYQQCKERIYRTTMDIRSLEFSDRTFDVVVAYGILHCLSSKEEINRMVTKIKRWIKPKGYFVCATFTDKIPPPSFQDYLEYEAFLSEGELQDLFYDWQVVQFEEGSIREKHQTSMIEHEHSISRLIARKL
jgi:tellurite methyltransferase